MDGMKVEIIRHQSNHVATHDIEFHKRYVCLKFFYDDDLSNGRFVNMPYDEFISGQKMILETAKKNSKRENLTHDQDTGQE